jgi:hypothetical protein
MSYRRMIASLLACIAVSVAAAEDLSVKVNGLVLSGTRTKLVALTVRDSHGQLARDLQPGIAVLATDAWSPGDPTRDGARNFKVLLTVAKLIQSHPLVGVIGIANRNGLLPPEAKQALTRSVLMGVPVVTVASQNPIRHDHDQLFIEAGGMSEVEARTLLSQCMLRFGNLQPSADPSHPSEAELSTLRRQVRQYQDSFNAANSAKQLASL